MADLTKLEFSPWETAEALFSESRLKEMERVLIHQFASYLSAEKISLKMGKQEGFVQIESALMQEDFYHVIQALTPLEASALQASQVLLDFVQSFWYQFLTQERNVYLPLDWESYFFQEVWVYARGAERFPKLEKLADEWLEQAKDVYPISMEL